MGNPFDPGKLARLDLADAREDRARVEKLLTALKKVAAYRPDMSRDDAVIGAIADKIATCSACRSVQIRKWPPTGMCDTHYSEMHKAQRDREHTAASGKYECKEIAVRALMDWEIAANAAGLAPPLEPKAVCPGCDGSGASENVGRLRELVTTWRGRAAYLQRAVDAMEGKAVRCEERSDTLKECADQLESALLASDGDGDGWNEAVAECVAPCSASAAIFRQLSMEDVARAFESQANVLSALRKPAPATKETDHG